jgi:hypothetical protein
MLFKSAAAVAGLVGLAQGKALAIPDYYPSDVGAYVNADVDVHVCVQVYVSTHVVAYPVAINQFFGDPTIIIINGGVTINVDSPTTISTIVTATSTVTSTQPPCEIIEQPYDGR